MALLISLAMLALSAWAIAGTARRLHRTNAGAGCWIVFGLLLTIGTGLGVWFAFNFEYQVSPQMRYASFPMPLAFFHLEEGHWVDFITPAHVMYPGLAANVASIAAVAMLPLLLVHRRAPPRRIP